jgi:hypothetical protein
MHPQIKPESWVSSIAPLCTTCVRDSVIAGSLGAWAPKEPWAIPVVDASSRFVGFVSSNQVVAVATTARLAMIMSAGDLALGSSLIVREADSVRQALRVMAHGRARVVAVVDDSGTPRGVVRDIDLLGHLAGQSELSQDARNVRRYPVSPSEIRLELLRQHAEIRLLAVEVKDAAAASGYFALNTLRVRTLRLVDKVGRHNREEEELLQGLRTVDAWDSVRADFMSEQHAAEHQHLWGSLLDASLASDVTSFREVVLPAIALLLEHMEREEKVYLSEDVLRDDAVVIDQSTG